MKSFLMLACLIAQTPAGLGVVAIARGRISLIPEAGGPAIQPVVGGLVGAGAAIETGSEGWIELHLRTDARIRASARTRLAFGPDARLLLIAGRVWIEAPRGLVLVVGSGHRSIRFLPHSAAVADLSASGELLVIPRAGLVEIEAGSGQILRARPGQVATFRGGSGAEQHIEARSGGAAIADAAVTEARFAVGDGIGLHAFLLEYVRKARLARLDPGAARELLRLDPEISAGSPLGLEHLLEEARRPSPFFER